MFSSYVQKKRCLIMPCIIFCCWEINTQSSKIWNFNYWYYWNNNSHSPIYSWRHKKWFKNISVLRLKYVWIFSTIWRATYFYQYKLWGYTVKFNLLKYRFSLIFRLFNFGSDGLDLRRHQNVSIQKCSKFYRLSININRLSTIKKWTFE